MLVDIVADVNTTAYEAMYQTISERTYYIDREPGGRPDGMQTTPKAG